MKKIFFSIVTLAALAACTKSEVAYEQPSEIGFAVVAGNMTKAAVDGTTFPTDLNMYIYANTTTNAAEDADYFAMAEFTYLSAYSAINTQSSDTKPVWGGGSSSSNRNPYYWPNVNKLHFAGFSKSGNVESATVAYNCVDNTLSITGYTPTGDDNDLMWFPSTEFEQSEGFGKNTTYVPVDMYHACSWITFLVKGDTVTGANNTTYTLTSLNITNIDNTANVVCTGSNNITSASTVWSQNEDGKTTDHAITFASGYTGKLTQTATNVESNDATTTSGNVVVIPQIPGSLELTYTYTSNSSQTITEVFSIENDNAPSLKLNEGNTLAWEPGKHYIYTITIKANEILVAPTPVDWTDENYNITVE